MKHLCLWQSPHFFKDGLKWAIQEIQFFLDQKYISLQLFVDTIGKN